MDTDKPEEAEGMAEKAKEAPRKRGWNKPVAISAGALLLIAVIASLIIGIASPASSGKPRNCCSDNLRVINGALVMYEVDYGQGTFPESIDALVPRYLQKIPTEPDGGYYYLDTSTDPPHAVCSKGHTY